MSDFKAKMHKIRFLLRLCPRPRWWSLQRFPDPLAVFQGLLLRGGRRKRRKGNSEGRENGRGREKRGRQGRGRAGPKYFGL